VACGGLPTGPALWSSYGSREHMRANGGFRFDLRRCVPMSREEEHRCALAHVKTRDPLLAERLVLANMRMVVALAHRYSRADDDVSDLVQEGNRGLLRAVTKFDPTRGIKFCTYAAWWIRAYMWEFAMNNWRLVKVGTTQAQRKLFFCLRRERDRLEQSGAGVDVRVLASRLRVKESEVVAMLERFAGGEISLDAPARSQEPDAATLGDLLSDASAPGPDGRVENAEFDQVLRRKLKAFGSTLRGRDAEIFRRRLLTDEPMKLTRLATKFGVSRERTRQVEQRLKARIRDYLLEELGDNFDPPLDGGGRRRKTIARVRANSAAPRFERPIVSQGFS
jgi:RNA polymerase sigma-32 factor